MHRLNVHLRSCACSACLDVLATLISTLVLRFPQRRRTTLSRPLLASISENIVKPRQAAPASYPSYICVVARCPPPLPFCVVARLPSSLPLADAWPVRRNTHFEILVDEDQYRPEVVEEILFYEDQENVDPGLRLRSM